jgi:hypothetical protein
MAVSGVTRTPDCVTLFNEPYQKSSCAAGVAQEAAGVLENSEKNTYSPLPNHADAPETIHNNAPIPTYMHTGAISHSP